MSLYRPSELRHFLQSLGISPNKQLSQNFLIDQNIINKIVAAGKVGSDDVVIEIGPGPGALTEALMATGALVIAIEKDRMLANALERLNCDGRLTVICEDVLKVDFTKIYQTYRQSPIKVVANLPYNITTPILVHLIECGIPFDTIVVMVQEEVARRFTATPGGKEYGSFTVYLNFFTTPRYDFKVGRKCFYPAPKVDSAIVSLSTHLPPEGIDKKKFFLLTRKAFQMRRKMLRRSLSEIVSQEVFDKAGISSERRPETLSLEDWVRLCHVFQ